LFVLAVILRVCDFFDFAQIVVLKANSLRARKSPTFKKKVTASERGEGSRGILLTHTVRPFQPGLFGFVVAFKIGPKPGGPSFTASP